MNKDNPIGVFDSGIGGLTVLEELVNYFPHENFIYVGDTLNCPYGIKTKEEITNLVTRVTTYLLKQNVKAIVIACNTANAYSNHLSELTNIPIIGVIDPTVKYAIKTTKNKKVAILATNATIDSNVYQDFLKNKLKSNYNIYPVKCSEFIPAIEDGEIQTISSYLLVKDKLSSLEKENIDTIVLGCTHFGLYLQEISSVFKTAKIITSGKPTAEVLKKVLKKHKLLNLNSSLGNVIINTTGDPQKMVEKITWFKSKYQGIYQIKI